MKGIDLQEGDGIEAGRDVVKDNGTVINAQDSFIVNSLNQTINNGTVRHLTREERVELNKKVKQIEQVSGEQGWITWRFIHRTIGVESVEDLKLDQKDAIHVLLDLLLERATLKKQNQGVAKEFAESIQQNTLILKSIETLQETTQSLTVTVMNLNHKVRRCMFSIYASVVVCIIALIVCVLISSKAYANGREPCDRGAGGVSHCLGDKFVCNNGTISQSKRLCSNRAVSFYGGNPSNSTKTPIPTAITHLKTTPNSKKVDLSASFSGLVVGVADGDTLTVLTPGNEQVKVRLAEIDAPEKLSLLGKNPKSRFLHCALKKQPLLIQPQKIATPEPWLKSFVMGVTQMQNK